MKALFGLVSLLVVLAIVGMLVSRQMKAVTTLAPVAGASASAPATVTQQAQQVQQKVQDDLSRAMEQGAARREEADK